MASASVPGMYGCGNQCPLALPGAYGPFPSHGGGRRTLFLCGRGGAGLFFQRLIQRDVPANTRFLVRPRLLTRVSTPSAQEGTLGGACRPLSCPQGSFPNLPPHQGIRQEENSHAPALSPL
jgi:hypothetical protein